ncbi:MAG TPA: hypothetical protein DEF48_01325 [Nostoc sp. UBA8866]|nr:asl1066 [Nostoc sp. PCC 7120 = FACHB-418]HBW28737.1 hypothetical protein [Nostoc sp. UBA8866]
MILTKPTGFVLVNGFLATFGDLGWDKAEGRRQTAEGRKKKKFPQLKLCLDYRTSASQQSRKRSPPKGHKSQ